MQGLTSSEAADRLKKFGPNRRLPVTQRAVLLQFLEHFRNPRGPTAYYLGFSPLPIAIFGLLAVEGGKQWLHKRLTKLKIQTKA